MFSQIFTTRPKLGINCFCANFFHVLLNSATLQLSWERKLHEVCEGNMFDCHKARCITEAATNSCHITHKQMDSSKETFFGLQYSMTGSLGALRALTSSWRPFGPLNFVLWALRPVCRARLS